ncbi:type II CRISPR RNA-guided endonuclease Cas9 [Chryseobacterium nematophagum]|uniref:CRISPR-associated endonuclease Cas9 n=1 Tax=Chryseobacterium nematophagum TaxID=2305228 RepID=A0A3M7L882_9FLAO|nr:type II CRISPR RNA-guided endonuclease Cas9 [Chryseobacterium nematophagum]RMZ58419.1 type II CRISPR RNA-guided endonuclease Cas9 [Chryseobacterium nematophagum]
MKTILGLDLGTNSIGWALIKQDFENKKGEILGMGSRIIPMGAELSKFEQGQAQTKNANRRIARGIRKLNKRYKQRRNKLIYILQQLGMLPEQVKLVNEFSDPNKLDKISILPISKNQQQLTAFDLLELRVKALTEKIELEELGKIIYKYNQLRGYSGGNSEPEKEDNNDDESEEKEKTNESFVVFSKILSLGQPEEIPFKGKKLNKRKITIQTEDGIVEAETFLDSLKENDSLELQFNIRRAKSGDTITIKLPNKTSWRKKMENIEKQLADKSKEIGREYFISELLFDVLKENRWAKIRNNVILRSRYESEFEAVWKEQSKYYPFLESLEKDKLQKILEFIFPGQKESQEKLRQTGLEKGLKYVIKNQVVFYQRELKDQSDLISNCRFEHTEKVIAKSHPVFQEYKIWEQINKLVINTKTENGVNRKGEIRYRYIDRPIPTALKEWLYEELQSKKEVSFGPILTKLKKEFYLRENVDFLNGMNAKDKLKGNDTKAILQKTLGELWDIFGLDDAKRQIELWDILYNGKGNEYDLTSDRTSKVLAFIGKYSPELESRDATAIKISKIKFSRNYSNLSLKAIENFLPLVRAGKFFDQNFSDTLRDKIIKLLNENVEDPFEKSAQEFLDKNQDVLSDGGIVNAIATILVYDQHTTKEYSKEELIKEFTEISRLKQGELRNPLVEQIINEALIIVREIWQKYGFKPDEIRIELARELKNNAVERGKMYSANLKSQKYNAEIRSKLIELKQEISITNIEKYKLWISQENMQEAYLKNYNDPSKSEIEKLKLWESQGHISPYTGQPIPLSELFNRERYDVDHIIPQSRYFDDSLANKIICEKSINNEKGNRTSMEYFEAGSVNHQIYTKEQFIDHANKYFSGKKRKNLLATSIPEDPIQRQIKDTQYISIRIREELNKIVGNENVKTTTGGVTDYLRNHWGLTDKFKVLLKERYETVLPKLAQLEYVNYKKETESKAEEYEKAGVEFNEPILGENIFIEKFKSEFIKKKNNKLIIKGWSKRIDHRHHAMDALVIACTQPAYIKRLNDLNQVLKEWLDKNKEKFFPGFTGSKTELLDEVLNLESEKRKEIFNQLEKFRAIEMPWNGFPEEAEQKLKEIIVSHKPKDKLYVSIDKFDINNPRKKLMPQIKLRGQLHEAKNYGLKNGKETKRIQLSELFDKEKSATLGNLNKITNEFLKRIILKHYEEDYKFNNKDAFSAEGILDLNKKLSERKDEQGNSKPHPPISAIKIYYKDPAKAKKKKIDDEDDISLQRLDRQKSFNNSLYVKTGDNYLFAVMEKEVFNKKLKKNKTERHYDLITFFDAANLLKSEFNDSDDKKNFSKEDLFKKYFEERNQARLLFTLKQGDFVYLPNDTEEVIIDESSSLFTDYWRNIPERSKNIYVVQKFSGKEIYFLKHTIADTITKKIEFGSQDCYQSLNGRSIKEFCFKINSDRLGNISKA